MQRFRLGVWITADFAEASQQPDRLNDFFFLQWNGAAAPVPTGSRAAGSASTSAYRDRTVDPAYWAHFQPARRPTDPRATLMSPFSSRNQLQKFLRIIQPLLEFGTERLSSDLGRDGNVAGSGIGRNKLDFIDSMVACLLSSVKNFLDLFDDILRLSAANSEGLHQT